MIAQNAETDALQIAIAQERSRFALEVHDVYLASLTRIRFLLEAALVSDSVAMTALIEKAKLLCIEGAQDARRSVWGLRPSSVAEGGGLVPSIDSLITTLVDTSICSVSFHAPTELELTSDQEDQLLRVCQESVLNVVKHANASQLMVAITSDNDTFVMTISDNGCGIPSRNRKGACGLDNISSRCKLIGADLKIDSMESVGTKITVSLPIQPI